jgi:RNA polymerase sigma factor (sigma-70 family)
MGIPPFQTFLDNHADEVWRWLAAVVGSQDAADCWQETFLAALRAYPRLDGNSNLRAWVLRIAQRKAVDHHRAGKRRPVPVEDLPERGVEEPEPDTALWKLVDELPNKQRAAIVCRFVSDLSYAEVGRVLGSSEEAARRNVHEGLKKLRKEWI